MGNINEYRILEPMSACVLFRTLCNGFQPGFELIGKNESIQSMIDRAVDLKNVLWIDDIS
jgi:hypothetical protein